MIDVLDRLRDIGYKVTASGDRLRCRWQGPGKPDPSVVRPLLDELRERKAEALASIRGEEQLAPPVLSKKPMELTYCRYEEEEGIYIACRLGVPEPIGRGETEFDAVMDLWGKEDALEDGYTA